MLQSPAAIHPGIPANTAAPAAKRWYCWFLVTFVKCLTMHVMFMGFEGFIRDESKCFNIILLVFHFDQGSYLPCSWD